MVETSWSDSLEFSKRSMPFWEKFFVDTFSKNGIEIMNITNKEDDPQYRNEGWDWLLVFRGQLPSLKVEIKTRTQDAYYIVQGDKYKRIAIEIMGNEERQKLGSSIYASNSDMYAYAFTVNGQLTDIRLIKTQQLSKWIKENEHKLEKKRSSTTIGNTLYHTVNVLVPLSVIDEKFLFDISKDTKPHKYAILEDDEL